LEPRGLGLMVGLEVCHATGEPATDVAMRVVKEMLRRGFILLPEGADGNVIGLTPPLIISKAQLRAAARELARVLRQAA